VDEPAFSDEDDSFLDNVFDSVVERLSNGDVVDPAAISADRPHLARRVDDIVRLAAEVLGSSQDTVPRVDGFEIVRELGRGACDNVYLARQHAVGDRLVALKVLSESSSLSPRRLDRFLAEIKALAKLTHPSVVPIYDVTQTGRITAYAMEWIDGSTLAQVIAELQTERQRDGSRAADRIRGVPASVREESELIDWFCRIGISIARALNAVHSNGLVHRDVKPSNILLRRDGTPLLSDFGLVKDDMSSLHTQTGQFLGTAAYV
jgi:serine/threonine protein kinase